MFEYEKYPNPQFCREQTKLLDGEWDFAILDGFFDTGVLTDGFTGRINVPYCPESLLSGVGYTGPIHYCKYRKLFHVRQGDRRVILHFGAVDYHACIYINNRFVAEHIGGYTPFSVDITDAVEEGENSVVVLVYDNVLDDSASGKQSDKDESYGCYYTRTTGIWQSVWLEYVPQQFVQSVRFYPSVDNCSVDIELTVEGKGQIETKVLYDGVAVGQNRSEIEHFLRITVPLSQKHLWEIGQGNLYDVEIAFNGDCVHTYFGLREVRTEGNRFLINGKSVFQMLVLDQGFYREGIYTAPNEREMKERIRMAQRIGFHGARLHQKAFEPKFLYYCDKSGYIVWGEYPSWGLRCFDIKNIGYAINEWTEEIQRDFNHPSIIAWCPLNEAWNDGYMNRGFVRECSIEYVRLMYSVTKVCDSTRPCVGSSGGFHCDETDLYDFHDYGGYDRFAQVFDDFEQHGQLLREPNLVPKNSLPNYRGQPLFVSEYGGQSVSSNGWGYNTDHLTAQQWVDNICRITGLIKSKPYIAGACYTQLYDVEQEQNGLYTYDDEPKFDVAQARQLKQAFTQKAQIED